MRTWLPLFLLFTTLLNAKVTYESLDPTSIRQHLAYYELYPNTPEGKKSLEHAWKLLSGKEATQIPLAFPRNIDAFISLINPSSAEEKLALSDEALQAIEQVAAKLPNRQLKGNKVDTVQALLHLEDQQIDIGRALLLTQLKDNKQKIRLYEAVLDLMSLQVLARTPKDAPPEEVVKALNQLIFFELGFRFPPHSSYSNAIDLFTFLPEVLESRRGVCLGVSTLYLCLAQRVGLPIEIITPPGHIFVRVNETNIETTLRGVHIHSDEYLGINLRSLPKRHLKEVIGMAFYNQASIYLSQGDFEKAKACYQEALPFMPDDAMLKILYGATLYLTKQESEALSILRQAKKDRREHILTADPLLDDLLQKRVDPESLVPFFLYVDETRASIEQKKEALKKSIEKCPQFLSGIFQLAICYLQLHQPKAAIEILEQYHAKAPNDITCEYYLAELYYSRYDIVSSRKHFQNAERIATLSGYMPKALERFKVTLSCQSPSRSE